MTTCDTKGLKQIGKWSLTILLLLIIASTAKAQWTQDTTFVPAEGDLFSDVHGVAVDGEGKVWIQPFIATENIVVNRDLGNDGVLDTLSTRAIYVYNADGTPASFSPLMVLEWADGTAPADTLGRYWDPSSSGYESRSGRGIEADNDGNIIISQWNTLFKVDYTTGKALAKAEVPNFCAITEASVDEANNIYVSSVCASGAPIIRYDSNLESFDELLTLESSFSRDFQVSPDGNTIWWTGYTTGKVLEYTRPDEFSGFSSVPDTVLSGLRIESFDIHPTTGELWVSSGSLNDVPEPPYAPQTWYAFNMSDLGTENEVPLDSIRWVAGADVAAGYDNARPRGLDFSNDGNVAYVGVFAGNETEVDLQKFVSDNADFNVIDVTFSTNTSVTQQNLNFHPDSQIVAVVGSFNGWDTNNPIIASAINDSVFEATVSVNGFNVGDTLLYKFIIRDNEFENLEWDSPDPTSESTIGDFADRFIVIDDTSAVSSPTVYFNDFEPADRNPDNYGISSLLDARALINQSHIAIEGIVTRTTYNFVYLQDETGATMAFSRPWFGDNNSISFNNTVNRGDIRPGDRIKISAITGDYQGLHEMLRIHGWTVVSRDNPLPAPQMLSLSEITNGGEQFESELVEVQSIMLANPVDTLFTGLHEIVTEDGSESGYLFIHGQSNTHWAGQPAPQGIFSFKGVVKEIYDSGTDSQVYALVPHDEGDILEQADISFELLSFPGLLGRTFDYPLYLTEVGSEPILGFEFALTFDPSSVNITVKADQTGYLAENYSVQINTEIPGTILISGADAIGTSDIGEFLGLTVEFLSQGIHEVYLEAEINEMKIESVISNLNIVSRLCGDVTGDETISALDATAVLRHTVLLTPEYPLVGLDSTAADVSGNGDISAFDASWILQKEVGLRSDLGCVTLPIKKNPEIVNASWFLEDISEHEHSVNLSFTSSDFDVYAVELELDLSDGLFLKGIQNLPNDWIYVQNIVGQTTRVSAYGVTPIEEKNLKLDFKTEDSPTRSTIEANLTLNESTFSDLETITIATIPAEFDLQQNYPNPFNPSTQIQYSLAENGVVNLSIFNMLGQKVAELVNSTQEAGNYRVTWNAGALSSGVYIYRLSTKSNTITKRMMLIK